MSGDVNPALRSLRIAFVTPEFVTTNNREGGLGNYLNRITRLCADRGHDVHVFVSTPGQSEWFEFDGVVIHHVSRDVRRLDTRARFRFARLIGNRRFSHRVWLEGAARSLANGVAAEERQKPFDLIQSSDYLGVGQYIKRHNSRPHIIRCSSAEDLYAQIDGDLSEFRMATVDVWRRSLLNADIIYTPSQFVADHLEDRLNIVARVIRPPAWVEAMPRAPSVALPDRFAIHFGQLNVRKGSEYLSQALPRVWAKFPDFKMVWVGRANPDDVARWKLLWGKHSEQILILDPVEKPELYAILSRAEFSVLPSLVDNLPNTVIESIVMGIPVVGFEGGSVNELVVPGAMGELVPMGNVRALSKVLCRSWCGESLIRRGFVWDTDLAEQMRPDYAVNAILNLALEGN